MASNMAFKFSPIRDMKKQDSIAIPKEMSVLKLMPFSPIPKIFFEDVKIGQEVVHCLSIQNPSEKRTTVTVVKLPPADRNIELNWHEAQINPQTEIVLELKWIPKVEGSWRDTVSLVDGRNVKLDIHVYFKTTVKKVTKRGKGLKAVKTKPVTVKCTKSPVRKFSPKDRKNKRPPFRVPDNICSQRTSNTRETVNKMEPPHRQNVLLPSQNSRHIQFLEEDKENSPIVSHNQYNGRNLNTSYNKLSLSEKLNRLECSPVFVSPRHVNFNCENVPTSHLRRDTYDIKEPVMTNLPQILLDTIDEFNDSLENENKSNEVKITPNVLSEFNRMNPNDSEYLAERLLSDSFTFSTTTVTKKSPKSYESLLNNLNFSHNIESVNLNNVNVEPYEHNISTGTYTIGNVSSCSTYSILSLDSTTKVQHRPSVEKLSINSAMRTSSPLIPDNNPNYLNFSGINAKSTISHNPDEFSSTFDITSDINTSTHKLHNITPIFYNTSGATKRKLECPSEIVITVSPPKRAFLKPRSPPAQKKLNTTRNKKLNLSTKTRRKSIAQSVTVTREPCHIDPFLTAAIYTNPSLDVTSTLDPFISSTLYYDEIWLHKQMKELKKWLNALLTPPSELSTNAACKKVDVAKLWRDCIKKELVYAPTKDKISSNYHTTPKLDLLRKSAKVLFFSLEMKNVLSKIAIIVENKQLLIRDDKNLHLDVGLQSQIMIILLCYNPLWLRIGLETIYNESIPLESNSDANGLSTFIMLRLFRNPDLMPKGKNMSHMKYLPMYSASVKKFTLKKFLMLIYFLDQAKNKRLIAHDPCLFCRDAPIKDSKELLLSVSRELISAVGDITKFLRRVGYEISHKQTYIDEFDYAVKNLGIDLRDGIRLTKAMEIILLRDDLTNQLRGPAISRLQKIHNVKLAIDSLEEAGYTIAGNITPKDIVDGHREKTLSLLWQIVYKFNAPMFIVAASTLQKWWKSLSMVIKRRIMDKPRQRKNNAAIKIQQFYRGRLVMLKKRNNYLQIKRVTVIIQRFYKSILLTKQCKMEYMQKRKAIVMIQRKYRALKLMKEDRQQFLQMRNSVVVVQRYFRANIAMKTVRNNYLKLKETTIKMQKQWRNEKLIKHDRQTFVKKREAAIIIQQHYRNIILMRKDRQDYLLKRQACVTIQKYFKSYLVVKSIRQQYLQLKHATIIIQNQFRAFQAMNKARLEYLIQRQSAVCIQTHFRAWLLMKRQRKYYLEFKLATVTIQQAYLAKIAMKRCQQQYFTIKKATVTIQRWYRNIVLTRQQQQFYHLQKVSACVIQQRFREYLIMKKQRQEYVQIKQSVGVIQKYFKGYLMMKKIRQKYLLEKESAQKIQFFYKSYIEMKKQRTSYLQKKQAVVTIKKCYRSFVLLRYIKQEVMKNRAATKIQSLYRMFKARKSYLQLKQAVLIIKNKYKAQLLMKQVRSEYLLQKQSAKKIQIFYKSYLEMKKERAAFLEKKYAVITIQKCFRSFVLLRYIKQEVRKNRTATKIQSFYRMVKARESYLQLKKAVITIENKYKAQLLMRQVRSEYLLQKESAQKIQIFYKSYLEMKKERAAFLEKKYAAISIQKYFRSFILLRYIKQEVIKNRAATKIQSIYRMVKARESYLQLKQAVITIENIYKAQLLKRQVRSEYLLQKESAKKIQIFYKSYSEMKKERAAFLEKKYAVITIQKCFRSFVLLRYIKQEVRKNRTATKIQSFYRMVKARESYLQLKKAVITIENKYKAQLLMRQVRSEYLLQKESAKKIQIFYKSYLEMKKERAAFLEKKCAAISIQKCFRSFVLLRYVKQEFIRNRAATKIQSFYRMVKARELYLQLKQAVITIEYKYKAQLLMRQARSEYLVQKESARKIQIFYKSYSEMKKERAAFLEKKYTVISIQKCFRSFVLLRYIKQEVMKNRAATKIQSCYRMIKAREEYLKLKHAVITLEQRYEAQKLMKQARTEYLVQKEFAHKIQVFYKSYLKMKNERILYLKKKHAAVSIQKCFRSFVLLRYIKQEVTKVRFAIKIQSWYRMVKTRKSYLKVKQAVLTVENHYEGLIMMRQARSQYLLQKKSVQTIQVFYKSYLEMKREQFLYWRKKKAAIIIQKTFRKYVTKQRYLQENKQKTEAAIKIQSWYRMVKAKKLLHNLKLKQSVMILENHISAYLLMKKLRNQYLLLKESSVKIQRFYRSRRVMQKERIIYLQKIEAAMKIQKCFRSYLLRKYIREENLKINAAVKIQSWYRMIVARKYSEQLREEAREAEVKRKQRRINSAAIKIQACWRGHKTRSLEDSNMTYIRQRCNNAQENAIPELTMGQRNLEAIELLMFHTSMKEVIRALTILDFTTRLFPQACTEFCDKIVQQLYTLLANTNRSTPDFDACTLSVSVLINLYKYEPTSHAVWKVNHIDTLFSLLLHWSDKEGVLFPYVCTLFWLFGQDADKTKIILEQENAAKILLKTYQQCERKQKMLSKMRHPNNLFPPPVRNPLLPKNTPRQSNIGLKRTEKDASTIFYPSLKPDWGIINRRHPRAFNNPMIAINCLLKTLNIGNMKTKTV